jgi:hypothetical protein
MKLLIGFWAALAILLPGGGPAARAQESSGAGAMSTLTEALSAACRQDARTFGRYFLPDGAAAYNTLPAGEQLALLRRFSLTQSPGRPLLSSGTAGETILRCESPAQAVEFRLGAVRAYENLAFIPVEVVGGEKTEFGLVRQGGGWRLLSLGLVLLDIPELEKRWGEEELQARERAAIGDLDQLAEAIKTYQKGFGKLPETLGELGPAPPNQVSPEAAQLVDKDLAAGEKDGYRFRYRILPEPGGAPPGFELAATPADYGKTGRRSFFLDAAGKLHGADKGGAVATEDDPVIEAGKAE